MNFSFHSEDSDSSDLVPPPPPPHRGEGPVAFKVRALITYNSVYDTNLEFEEGQVISVCQIYGDRLFGKYIDRRGVKYEGWVENRFVELVIPWWKRIFTRKRER
jgi:hypothetical protein